MDLSKVTDQDVLSHQLFLEIPRPNPMTVRWSKFAQEQTSSIVKGMLTGPITILQWSFVRDDQPRQTTAEQIAFAIRDER